MAKQEDVLQPIHSLCKRRGFIFQSSEIYGGLNSCWDYGPLGIELKRNIKDSWWNEMTLRSDVEGLDSSILMAPRVWEASGHVENFTDPLVDCKKCRARLREDKLEIGKDGKKVCSSCGSTDLTEARSFNLMFKTFMGPLEDSASVVYLRPETAQGIYVNFHNVATSMRKQVPFGIAQIGKAFRNEITPGNFIFRTREFEQMEMQFFVKPGEDDKWMEYWKEKRWDWHIRMGINPQKLRFHPHGPGELAHYAKSAFDVEYEFPFGWSEIEGVHNRTDFDLGRHQEYSKKNLQYVDPQNPTDKYLPYIIETSVGADRFLLAALCDAYHEDAANERIVLRFVPALAPVKVAVLPLSKKPELEEISKPLFDSLATKMRAQYDSSGSIGKRYRRQEEIGTPYCITVDFDSINDKAVTIRHRDTMEQTRVPLDKVDEFIAQGFKNWSR
ncbi:MAG TPA: glycine--tRNA ligase [Bdellovibrionota bacterium]|jgi:glycyl-tRNA synthetase|nr:glycine--tRNA ligase [Bdellovibrionota bacterium]